MSKTKHRSRSHTFRQTVTPSALFACLLLVLPGPTQAQSERQYPFLVFDPVALEMPAPAAAGTARELEELPATDSVALSRWLRDNSTLQGNAPPQLTSDVADYERSIRELETTEGPFSLALPQQLLGLGTAHQATGELDLALQYFEQASHIMRINHGLFSNEQLPIIERIIENHLRRGDLLAADEQHSYLLFLQQKNLGNNSVELLPALQRYGEWNMFAFSSGSWAGNSSGSRVITLEEASFKIERLLNAQHIYWSIVDILRNNFGAADPRLPDAEMRLVLTNYLYATSFASRADIFSLSEINSKSPLAGSQLQASPISHMGYRHGKDALERRVKHLQSRSDSSAAEVAAAALDVADWMLLFNRQRNQALELYEEIYRDYAQQLEAEELQQLFTPHYPSMLPLYINAPYSRATLGIPPEQALKYEGHIDLEFKLNRFGRVTQIQVLGYSETVPEVVSERLLRNVRNSQFRPRLQNGVPMAEDRVQARYYFAY